ncbi:hypothetical protein BU17DRAFT_60595 [Hysterangium stoloniferum]|nr:hypothetical protein BU17DRAFT_60595 [Hysterangium stoloniferum]
MNPNNSTPPPHTLDREQSAQYSQATLLSSSESLSKPRLQQKWKGRLHPLSLMALGVWVCYIVATIFVLEKAVKNDPLHIEVVWRYDVLPGSMLTFFAQGHLPITVFHLARVGVSAIQRKSIAPRTQDELFLMTDRAWSGPVGIAGVVITMIRGVRVSLIFLIFAFTCMVAFVTPETLSRAYPVGLVNVTKPYTVTPRAFSPQALPNVDRDTQIGLGLGSWATGLSIFDIYEFSVYKPNEIPPDFRDFFFSGSVQDIDVRLPGLRLQGACAPFSDDALPAVEQDTTLFPMFCNNTLPLVGDQAPAVNVFYGNANVTYSYCTYPSVSTVFSGPDSNATAYILLQTNNGTVETTGMVKCQSNFSIGTALLSGTDWTYTSFLKNITYDNPIQLANPLSAVLAGIANGSVVNHTFESGSTLVKQLGYNVTIVNGNTLNSTQPSLDTFAKRIWFGVEHMTAGMDLLSSASDITYRGSLHYPTFGRTRSNAFANGLYALLASWLCGLIYLSFKGYRLSTESHLGSRIAIRLYEGMPLRESQSQVGEFFDDEQLSRPVVSPGILRN